MQNFNFFQWVRDGVRQSVLLGVSDAIETIGSPDDPAELHPAVAALMGDNSASRASRRRIKDETVGATAAGPGRKRLGRSLKDLEPGA